MADKPITDEALEYIEQHLKVEKNSPFQYTARTMLALVARIRAAEATLAERSTALGVGDGRGELFVYGSYDAIKAAQAFIFRAEKAEAERGRLREALKPFAEIAAQLDRDNPSPLANDATVPANTFFNMGDLRAARAALEEGNG